MKERVLTPQPAVSMPAQSGSSNQSNTAAIYTPQAAKLAILRSTPQRPYQELLVCTIHVPIYLYLRTLTPATWELTLGSEIKVWSYFRLGIKWFKLQ